MRTRRIVAGPLVRCRLPWLEVSAAALMPVHLSIEAWTAWWGTTRVRSSRGSTQTHTADAEDFFRRSVSRPFNHHTKPRRRAMRLVIENTPAEVGELVAAYVIKRINDFKPTASRPFILGLPTAHRGAGIQGAVS